MIGFNKKGNADFSTSIGRWMGLGPYYAMFPMRFAFEVVNEFTSVGDSVIDPFAGRGSTVYAAASMQRRGLGIEINPVGWLYGKIKLHPATKNTVLRRIHDIGEIATDIPDTVINEMPEFYHWCYSKNVLRYLLAARANLNWRNSIIDGTLMAIILVDLHGKRGSSLSNQMRQSKAMAPDYSINWWRNRNMPPPDINPVQFLNKKVDWRYTHHRHQLDEGKLLLGDSTSTLSRVRGQLKGDSDKYFKLLLTSPPYYDVTNYHYDQWIRLWMLGGDNLPMFDNKNKWQKKFSGQANYKELLYSVFKGCSEMMADDGIVYVRTDMREFTFNTTLQILMDIFPNKRVSVLAKPIYKPSQTALFGDKTKKPGEADIILQPVSRK